MRPIDADKLKKHYSWWKGGTREMTMDEAKNDFDTIVDLQPTVEAEPIKHGRWEVSGGYTRGSAIISIFRCSVCECESEIPSPYCPQCGAKMDGGEDATDRR